MTAPETTIARSVWADSNLYRNPFGEMTLTQRAEVAVVDVQRISGLLGAGNRVAVQFIGKCGRGKTTRMLKLAAELRDSSYTYLPEDGRCPAIPMGQVVLIDEAQRLRRAVRHKVFATGVPLALATHRSLTGSLRRHGYTVFTERIGTAVTAELVQDIFNRRIEASRYRAGPLPHISLAFSRRLVNQFGTNIRGMENHMYEWVQQQVSIDGKVRFDD